MSLATKRYPAPNKHGIYQTKQADEMLQFAVQGKNDFVIIRVMEVSQGEWITSESYRIAAGGGGCGLSKSWGVFKTKEEAIEGRIATITRHLRDEISGSRTAAQLDACRDLLKQIEEHRNQGRLF